MLMTVFMQLMFVFKLLKGYEQMTRFFSKVRKDASELCEEPVLPRVRRPPKRIDDGAAQHVFPSINEYFRKEYYEANRYN